jgi:hypothetical protein
MLIGKEPDWEKSFWEMQSLSFFDTSLQNPVILNYVLI